MTRRRLVALVSASVFFALGLLAVAAVLFVTRTNAGRERLRGFIQPLVSRAVKAGGGSIYIGHLGQNLLAPSDRGLNVTIDSVAIRDKRGELLVSTGPISFWISPRDLIDNRIVITKSDIAHPYVHLIQHETGVWNFKEIFASGGPPGPPKPKGALSFGDYIVIDSTAARDVTFLLTMPWDPDEIGRARDSVIKAHLTNPEKAVAKTFDGYGRTYAWRNGHGLISHVRLADPDSDKKAGKLFVVDSLSVDEYQPTFKFRNLRATVKLLGDSIWLNAPHFDMPGSTGHGKGKIWWGSDLPVRYDLAIRGDSVSLNDVNWVYPDLPRTGGGSLDLYIKHDPKTLHTRPHIVDFQLANMDVKSTKSHLTGAMTFGTGAPVLIVKDVDLKAQPVDFDLLRTLAGKPFPEDWQGQLIGTVKGRGGPLTNFAVDNAQITFDDAHVRGAVSRFTGKGELDILQPAFTAFHGVDVDASVLDLRTIEYLFPNFPRLGGTVSGTARLDSSWLDVRFSDAHLTHQDGPGEPSQFTGSGRITYGEPYMIYDLALEAEPVSLTMLARSYPMLPFRGLASGPVRLKGTTPDLELSTALQGAWGGFGFDGRLDIDSVGGYGAHGRGQFAALNLPSLLDAPRIPAGVFSGQYDVDVTGATAATLLGHADVQIERTVFDSVRVYPSLARVHFADGRMTIDSLHLRTSAATLTAAGGIGLPGGTADSLRFSVSVDSLGGLRRYISHPDTTLLGAAATLPDSLSGSVTLTGLATGTFDSLNVSGRLRASDIDVNRDRAAAANATFNLTNLLHAPAGTIALRADTLTYGGVALDTLGATLHLSDAQHVQFALGVLSHNGPMASAAGAWESAAGAQTVSFDSAAFTIDNDEWRLARRARLFVDSTRVRLDSLVLRNRDSAFIALNGDVPDEGAANGQLRAASVPLRDIGLLLQLTDTLRGVARIEASIVGTKAAPDIDGRALLSGIGWGALDVDTVTIAPHAAAGRVTVDANVIRHGERAVQGHLSLPLDVTLFGSRWRTDTVSGYLKADSTDLAIFQPLFSKSARDLRGRLNARVEVSGTMRAPVFTDSVTLKDASMFVIPMGVSLSAINGSIAGRTNAAGQDSTLINLNAVSEGEDRGNMFIKDGWIKNALRANSQPTFDVKLNANRFHVLSRRSLADLYVTTSNPLRLQGSVTAPTLTGTLTVDRGSIYLVDSDLARKQAVEIISDSAGQSPVKLGGPALLTTLLSNLQIQNVTVALGNDVRLRSREANVRLEGELSVVTSSDRTRTAVSTGQLIPLPSLEGTLRTVGGTYTLDLALVQREFEVLPNGTVTFDGPPENPALAIKAQYNVKQYNDRDLTVLVNLDGRLLPYPTISFSSNADYQIGPSDLLSYLLIGRPGFDFGANAGTTQMLASVLGPTVSAYTADKLRQTLGSWADFGFQLGTANPNATNTTLSSYLTGSTLSAGKQLGNNFYVNVNTGFCPNSDADPNANRFNNFLNGLGAKLDYRFNLKTSAQFAYDPPAAKRSCSDTYVGLVPAPSQYSFSLSHTWRF